MVPPKTEAVDRECGFQQLMLDEAGVYARVCTTVQTIRQQEDARNRVGFLSLLQHLERKIHAVGDVRSSAVPQLPNLALEERHVGFVVAEERCQPFRTIIKLNQADTIVFVHKFQQTVKRLPHQVDLFPRHATTNVDYADQVDWRTIALLLLRHFLRFDVDERR